MLRVCNLLTSYIYLASSEEEKKCTTVADLFGTLSCCATPTQPTVATARAIVANLSNSSVSWLFFTFLECVCTCLVCMHDTNYNTCTQAPHT